MTNRLLRMKDPTAVSRGRLPWPALSDRFVLALMLFLTACAAPFEAMIQDDLPPESPRGYLEFYCIDCIAGWGVFRIENGEEVVVGQQPLGKKIASSMKSPVRMKRLRIAQEPGSHVYVIRLMPYAFWEGHNYITMRIRITENELTPVRIHFDPWIETIQWRILTGASLPLSTQPESLEVLASGLNHSEWETRWYTVQLLGAFKGPLPEAILSRLDELSGDEADRQCREVETRVGCNELHKVAVQAVKKLKAVQP